MLWHACVYISNIKPMGLLEAALGIFMYLYANLPLVAPILLLCLWLLRISAVQLLLKDVLLVHVYLSLLMMIIKSHPSLSLKL